MIRPAAAILSLALFLGVLPATGQETDAPASASLSAEQIDALTAAIAEALNEAVEARSAHVRPSQPLTLAETSAFQEELMACWNVVPLSTEALTSQVSVAFDMNIDGTPVSDSIRLVSSEGDERAVQEAFEAARDAILSCSAHGLNLPPEKYELWAKIELTFMPRR